MNFLSCGVGVQSTALALMSCENALYGNHFPEVPIYDAIIFCDLGLEPPWVYEQVEFLKKATYECIPFYIIDTYLHQDYIQNFGKKRVTSIPFWCIGSDGKLGRMPRHCTIDYKIIAIQRFIRTTLLGYKKGERTRKEDVEGHTMHMGFSVEEQHRIFTSKHKMFVNRFPLVEMSLTRADNYKYLLEVWRLNAKSSACCFCPYHTNYFYRHLRDHYPDYYKRTVEFDELLYEKQQSTKIQSQLFLSKSRKRITNLTDDECNDAETFDYNDKKIWNGF